MERKKYTRDDAIALLTKKHTELLIAGDDRYPRRGDFSDDEAAAIKAHLGPWPRALEAAELKPPRDGNRLAKNREKRRRAKLRRSENENDDSQ